MLQRLADPGQRPSLERLLQADKDVGLCLSERMINMPPALAPSLYDSLLQVTSRFLGLRISSSQIS